MQEIIEKRIQERTIRKKHILKKGGYDPKNLYIRRLRLNMKYLPLEMHQQNYESTWKYTFDDFHREIYYQKPRSTSFITVVN